MLRRFRNEVTHTVAYPGNPLPRVKGRRGQNDGWVRPRRRGCAGGRVPWVAMAGSQAVEGRLIGPGRVLDHDNGRAPREAHLGEQCVDQRVPLALPVASLMASRGVASA